MEIVIILLILRFVILPLFAFWFYEEDLEDSLAWAGISLIPILGELLFYKYIKEQIK